MKVYHAKRLKKLADHLKRGKLGHENFDISCYNRGQLNKSNCGTSGCAIGECPILFPRSWRFSSYNFAEVTLKGSRKSDAFNSARVFFGLSLNETFHLFWTRAQKPTLFGGQTLGDNATRHQVASNIYAFLKVKGF